MKRPSINSGPLNKQQSLSFIPYIPSSNLRVKYQEYPQKNNKQKTSRYDSTRSQLSKQKSHSCSHRKRQKSKSQLKQNYQKQFGESNQTKKVNQQLRQQQIKEEYDLYATSKHKNQRKTCQFQLHNCKHIENYLLRIRNQISAQKQKNKILKRRNHELSKQNKVFNEYFQIFQPKFQQLLQKCDNNSKNSKYLSQYRARSKINKCKSHDKIVLHDRVQNSKDKINAQISYSKLTLKTADPTKSSFITDKSSREKSKQHRHTSRFDEFYSRC